MAYSGGSLLNLAQGKFGRYNENDVRWLAAVGTDYGAIIVAESSPFKSLKDLVAAVKADPTKVVFGAGGTVGSQDWMKAALTAKAAGLDPARCASWPSRAAVKPSPRCKAATCRCTRVMRPRPWSR